MNWKHTITGEIISQEHYDKLPRGRKSLYLPVNEEPTHKVEEDDNNTFITPIIFSQSYDTPSPDYSSSPDVSTSPDISSNDFGGGDSGGGGANGDF